MFVLITYDVATDEGGARRLRRVARACKDWGQRVQYSVFECIVDPGQWTMLKNRLVKEMNLELDSMRFYYLGSSWKRKIEHIGAKEPLEQEGPLIV
jgi:CRISPR-associated protein Cas2